MELNSASSASSLEYGLCSVMIRRLAARCSRVSGASSVTPEKTSPATFHVHCGTLSSFAPSSLLS
eukprot:6162821-Prymnesium_polylepis.2